MGKNTQKVVNMKSKKQLQNKIVELEDKIVIAFNESNEKIDLENKISTLEKDLSDLEEINSEQEKTLENIDKKIMTGDSTYNKDMREKIRLLIERRKNGN